MSPRQALRYLQDLLAGSEFDRALARARRSGRHRFLFGWNRGLGDVGLSLGPYMQRAKRAFPDASVAVITREELAPIFAMAGADTVHAVPGLARGTPLDLAGEMRRLGLDPGSFGAIFPQPDPTRWDQTAPKDVGPRLVWPVHFGQLADRISELDAEGPWVGVHVHSETHHFYRYVKDWPAGRWPELFERVRRRVPARFVLFGIGPGQPIDGDGILDLRGRLTFPEVLAVIGTRTRALVAPDSGILSIAYFLDWQCDLDIVSLWADPRQGVLKGGWPSPNARLRHFPLVGPDEDVGRISVDDVERLLLECLARPRPALG